MFNQGRQPRFSEQGVIWSEVKKPKNNKKQKINYE